MSNSITASILKFYGPSLPNRDDSGDAKQIIVGGTTRSRISSQCLKRAIRQTMDISDFRSSHLEDLVESILLKKFEGKDMKQEQIDKIGSTVCTLIGCDWDKRASAAKKKSSDKKKGSEEGASGDAEAKGRTVVVASSEEISAIVDAALNAADDKMESAARNALKTIRMTKDKALFGTMVASKGCVLESVDGAVQVSQTYSIDEYVPESDYIIAAFADGSVDESDPFFGDYKAFAETESKQSRANAIADSWMYSNIMYSHTSVNIKELMRNLSTSAAGNLMVENPNLKDETKELVSGYVSAFATTEPFAKQNSMSSHSAPAILYVEAIKNGSEQYASFDKAIRNEEDLGVIEQGIEKILDFASDDTFRTGEIKRYVLLSRPYKGYEKDFEAIGITVLNNLKELDKALGEEIERLS